MGNSFFTMIGAGRLSEFVPNIKRLLCCIALVALITVSIRRMSRITQGPGMNSPKKTQTTPWQEM
jgi:hypothetical protein